jgi:polyphosphate kinase 2
MSIPRKEYVEKLRALQTELCLLQRWVREEGQRVVIVFEGRDAAGKGGCIRAMTERINPRFCRVVALQAPTEREKSQMYLQRYIQHLPAAGEIVIFDRSWYNRAGVEYVMEFEGPLRASENRRRFFEYCSRFEKDLVDEKIFLFKFWLDVDPNQQRQRIHRRISDPLRFWKLSKIDLQSPKKWREYSIALNEMLHATAKDENGLRWYIVDANDKRRARLNCIAHVLNEIPYEYIPDPAPELKVDISMYRYLMHDRPARTDSHIVRGAIDGVVDLHSDLFEKVVYKKPPEGRRAEDWEDYVQNALQGEIDATFEEVLEKVNKQSTDEAKANYLIGWSFVYGLLNKFSEVEQLARQALSLYEKLLPADHLTIAETVDYLAEALAAQDKNKEAADLFPRGIAIFEKNYGSTDPRLAKHLIALAMMYQRLENDSEEDKVLGRVLSLYKEPKDENLELAIGLSMFADLHAKRGDAPAAEDFLRRALAIRERIQGTDNIALASDLLAFAMICIATEKLDESETTFKRLISVLKAKLGPLDPQLVNPLEGYITLLSRIENREADAELLKKEVEAIKSKAS